MRRAPRVNRVKTRDLVRRRQKPPWMYSSGPGREERRTDRSWTTFYLESSVVFHHDVGEVDPLSAADKASDFWMVVCADVVSHEVPVDAVPATFLLVEQHVRGWRHVQLSHVCSLRGVKATFSQGPEPLTFLSHLDVLADSDVFAPGLLDDPSKTVVLPLPHLLQQEELQR